MNDTHCIYDKSGLKVCIIDDEAVSVEVDGIHRVTMTLDEWSEVNKSIECCIVNGVA